MSPFGYEFVDKLEAVVAKYKVPKQYSEMEITESIFSQEDSSAIALIYNLKEHGFTISMTTSEVVTHRLTCLEKCRLIRLKSTRYLSTVLKMFSEVKLLLRKLLIWHRKFTLKQSAVSKHKVNVIS